MYTDRKGEGTRRTVVGVAVLMILSLWAFTPMSVTAQGEEGPCGPMDVVFVVDDTGSMGGAISNVKSGLASIITQIDTASGGDFQIGLVSFKDAVEVDEQLEPDDGSVGTAVAALTASGGSGEPEASDEALNTTVNALAAAGRPQDVDFADNWRPGAVKIAIVVTDARPGGFNDAYTPGVDDVNAHNVALDALARGILISSIHVLDGFLDAEAGAVLQDYATTTGGTYTEVPFTGEGTSTAIEDIVTSCGAETPTEGPCPFTQGFWKNHAARERGKKSLDSEWPVDSLTIGGATYTEEELVKIFNTAPKGDASLVLIHQLIAAMLNFENGTVDQPIDETVDEHVFALVSEVVDEANAHFADLEAADPDAMRPPGKIGYGVEEGSDLANHLVGLSEILDTFNNGIYTPGCNADVSVEKTGEDINAGEDLTWSFTVSSNGPGTATDVNLTDDIGAGDWTVETTLGTCSETDGELFCEFGDMAAGTSATVTASRPTTTDDCGEHVNTGATAGTSGVDNDDANNVDGATIFVACPDAAVSIDAPATASGGEFFPTPVTIGNIGPDTAFGVTLEVVWSAVADPGPALTAAPVCDPLVVEAGSFVLRCDLGDMLPGEEHVISVAEFAVLDCDFDLGISAVATVAGGDVNLANNEDDALVDILCPDLAVGVTGEETVSSEDGTTAHPVDVGNLGDGDAENTVLTLNATWLAPPELTSAGASSEPPVTLLDAPSCVQTDFSDFGDRMFFEFECDMGTVVPAEFHATGLFHFWTAGEFCGWTIETTADVVSTSLDRDGTNQVDSFLTEIVCAGGADQ